ncbi:hypothetical protein IL992_44100 [Microbispora sp. NEAU-D428]|uniref:GDSL-type esterase/lipase family protein n=1 Tax=Microbispora sitophila TaxID=2771537 RepID=UPI0018686047|nr:GDSL-type esterase/lipase family protein [Microbispora sitophila]MBE3016084.1 hypothetical protein [Microbispora sitophila]
MNLLPKLHRLAAVLLLATVPSVAGQHDPVAAEAALSSPIPAEKDPGASRADPGADTAVTATADTAGYHLFIGEAGGGWKPLASLRPGGYGDEAWTGEHCRTGDGRFVVAVIAPWHTANSEAGMNQGGLAYAVDVRTGAVRPLGSGVSLAYFNPGCGTGHEVALTSYLGAGQRPTRITVVDAGTGKAVRSGTADAELTSAVAAADGIVAVRGSRLVRVTGSGLETLATLPGPVEEVRPATDGGVDLVVPDGHTSTAWHWNASATRRIGSGPAARVHLYGGRTGHNFVTGLSEQGRSEIRSLTAGAREEVDQISLDGGLAVLAPAGAHTNGIRTRIESTGAQRDAPLPEPAAGETSPLPARSFAAAAGESPETGPPTCSVARNDVFKQVWQPTTQQVLWAVNQAVQGYLIEGHPSGARPPQPERYSRDDAHYAPVEQAYPSEDFPLVAGAPHVPPLVMYGILAQESNFSQASWHAIAGRSGNPLIANYYGTDATLSRIDYSAADCGYGIAQITDGMRFPPLSGATIPDDRQVRVAVDYATNIAAAAQILQTKWVQLHDLGIRLNDDDPQKVENWYGAIWGYNSGVHTDAADRRGLGWLNNPANPIYPSTRHAFLHDGLVATYGDARTPSHWPYQERVFGWMEVPQLDGNGYLRYRGTYDWDAEQGTFLSTPPHTLFCRQDVNFCDPLQAGHADPCPSEDTLCWWDRPVAWGDCPRLCVRDTPTDAPNGHVYYPQPGTPEPSATPLSATCSVASVSPGANAVVVDEEILDTDRNPTRRTPNLMGCDAENRLLLPPAGTGGTFTVSDSDGKDLLDLAGTSSLAAIDLHQIGGGMGGHAFFTHTIAKGDTAYEVRATWTGDLPADPDVGTVYEIKVFVPDLAAASSHATYTVDDIYRRTINQNRYANRWVSLGYYLCRAAGDRCSLPVTLSNITPDGEATQGADIAFDAVAFVPVPTGGYVALGDSYSSGEGTGVFDDGTDYEDNAPGDAGNLCHRSTLSWPRLLAGMRSLPVVELACAGSNLWDVAGVGYYLDQKTEEILPNMNRTTILNDGSLERVKPEKVATTDNWLPNSPNPDRAGSDYYSEPVFQLDLLRALKPRLVTVTVGGNDLGFADVIVTCMNAPPCKDGFSNGAGRPDKIDVRVSSLRPLLLSAYLKIAEAAGGADKVYVVTYPGPVAYDPSRSGDTFDCSGIVNSDRQWLVPKGAALAAAISAAAADAGVHAIDIHTLFAGQEACVGGYVTWPELEKAPGLSYSVIDNWFHPSRFGYEAMAQAINDRITLG